MTDPRIQLWESTSRIVTAFLSSKAGEGAAANSYGHSSGLGDLVTTVSDTLLSQGRRALEDAQAMKAASAEADA